MDACCDDMRPGEEPRVAPNETISTPPSGANTGVSNPADASSTSMSSAAWPVESRSQPSLRRPQVRVPDLMNDPHQQLIVVLNFSETYACVRGRSYRT
jgi:hypothetical protein